MHNGPVTRLLAVSNKEVWSCSVDNTVKVWSSEGEYVADARTQDQVYCLTEVPGPRGDTKVDIVCPLLSPRGSLMNAHMGRHLCFRASHLPCAHSLIRTCGVARERSTRSPPRSASRSVAFTCGIRW